MIPDPYPSISSRHTGEDAERFEAGRPIVLGFFEVCRLAEQLRRLHMLKHRAEHTEE